VNKSLRTLAAIAGVAVLACVASAIALDGDIIIDRALNSPVLNVKYTGAGVTLVELRVNGVSVATRNVSAKEARGEVNFTLDMGALREGDNAVEVRMYDSSGKLVGTQQSRVSTAQGNPVALEGVRMGQTVTGPLEIKVGLKREIRNAYVSFFINDEFKILKNFPPYTYLWDTTRTPNGWYDIEAWVVDESNNTFKTSKTRVLVNNPSGRTERRFETSAGQVDVAPTDAKPAKVTEPGPAKVAPDAKPVQPNVPREPLSVARDPIVAQVTAPASAKVASSAGITTGAKSIAPTVKPQVGDKLPAVKNTVPPVKVAPRTTPVNAAAVAKPIVAPAPKANVTKPAPAAPKAVPAATIRNASAVTTAATPAITSIAKGQRIPNIGNFTILLNSRTVLFPDVQPRVLDGIPLTPFRHLFETAGGNVRWVHGSKQVDAEGLGKKILIRIGNKIALINENEYTLELAPFIERGRTVVPLSFVADSLNVKVDYDPATGHVLITEAKK